MRHHNAVATTTLAGTQSLTTNTGLRRAAIGCINIFALPRRLIWQLLLSLKSVFSLSSDVQTFLILTSIRGNTIILLRFVRLNLVRSEQILGYPHKFDGLSGE